MGTRREERGDCKPRSQKQTNAQATVQIEEAGQLDTGEAPDEFCC